jgi:hypothetical protein
MPSRVDLCVDFQTDVDMEGFTRQAWVTRAGAIDAYSRQGNFTGWTIGPGGPISARLYNKSLEIAQKSGKTFFIDLWKRAGSPTSMQIYAHARNVRFRGQLEALEPARRGERVKSFSEAAGLPKEVIDAYLANRRRVQADFQLKDAGEELLFTGAAIKDLKRAATKLGTNESERMQTLLRIRTSMAKKRR